MIKLGKACFVGCLAALVVSASAQVRINEIRRDESGTDNSEYFELFGAGGASLNDLTYLVIGDGAGGSGVIESVVGLAGLFLPGDGYFVCAEETFDTAFFGSVVDYQVLSNALNFENSDNVTHMLVSGFSGALNDDLDTNDDGVFDATPWTGIEDWVSIIGPGTGDLYYAPDTVGPDGTFHPGHVYRWPNGTGAWNVGPFDIYNGGVDTPGFSNVPEPGMFVALGGGVIGLLVRRKKA